MRLFLRNLFLICLIMIFLGGCTLPEPLASLFSKTSTPFGNENINSEEVVPTNTNVETEKEKVREEFRKCQNYATVELQNDCMKDIIVSVPCAELAEYIEENQYIDYIYASCYILQKKIWDCKTIKSENNLARELCYMHDSELTQDESFCFESESLEFLVGCVGKVAALRDNYHLCGLLSNTRQRYGCINAYAETKKDYAACENVKYIVDMSLLKSVYDDPIGNCQATVEASMKSGNDAAFPIDQP